MAQLPVALPYFKVFTLLKIRQCSNEANSLGEAHECPLDTVATTMVSNDGGWGAAARVSLAP